MEEFADSLTFVRRHPGHINQGLNVRICHHPRPC
jgi:hypothetical protein